MSEGPEWFAPKRFGYGAGLPISWQGWALTIGFTLITGGLAVALRDRPVELIAALALPVISFLVICAKTTRGGWRWRWGRKIDDL
jgi:hypothetical protein